MVIVNSYLIKNKILSSILILGLIYGMYNGLIILENNCVKAISYSTPGTGVYWHMDDLVANSNGNITYNSGIYTIHNDTIIAQNDILVINPGTIIKMKKLTVIRVYGTLKAIGTKDNMITFTQDPTGSNWPDDWIDHWTGFIFWYSCNYKECILDYCIIEHAGNSIVVNAPITITNCRISTRFNGIFVYGNSPILKNNIINCEQQSLYFSDNSSVEISDCKLETNEFHCVQLINCTMTMKNCTINTLSNNNFELDKKSRLFLYNTTFDHTKIYLNDEFSSVFIIRYLGVKVVDINNNSLSDARVKIFDKNNIEVYNQSTDSEGKIGYIDCIEYELLDITEDGDCLDNGEKIYHTPHKIEITKSGFAKHEDAIDIYQDKSIIVYLYRPPSLIKNIPDTYYLHEDLNDGNDLINLEEYFWDEIDDGNLNFEVVYEENKSLIDALINDQYLDFIQKKENWFGLLKFQVKAIDSNHLECISNIFQVVIKPTNDPPIIKDINGKLIKNNLIQFTPIQNKYFNATINITEVDGEQLFFSTNISKPNFNLNYRNGDIVFLPRNDDVGVIYGNISVTDENYTKDIVNITFFVENINDRPEIPLIIAPMNYEQFKLTDSITFNGSCNDIDLQIYESNEKLRFIWWSNISGKLGEGELLQINNLIEGKHSITLEVIDKEGLNNTANILIEIIKDDFDVTFQPPFCTLFNPINREIINNLEINLTWTTNFTKPEMITYDIYFDTNPNPIKLIGEKINDTKYFLNYLKNGKTYYWKVVPYLDNLRGNCSSGVWNFKIELDHLPTNENDNKSDTNNSYFIIIVGIIILIIIILIFSILFFIRKKKKDKDSAKLKNEQSTFETLNKQPLKYLQQLPQYDSQQPILQPQSTQLTPIIDSKTTQSESQIYCSTCKQPLKQLTQNNRYYCNYCRKYA